MGHDLSRLGTRFRKYGNVLTGDLPVAAGAARDALEETNQQGIRCRIYEIGY